jgi:hypothetical protein
VPAPRYDSQARNHPARRARWYSSPASHGTCAARHRRYRRRLQGRVALLATRTPGLYQLLACCTVPGLPSGHLACAKGSQEPARRVGCQSGAGNFCHASGLSPASAGCGNPGTRRSRRLACHHQ